MPLSLRERHILAYPQRSISVSIPVSMDDGVENVFHGIRVQYNDALGPTKGGIRYHPQVDEEEVAELAFLMSMKTALAGLPYGGAKGGVTCDPKTLSHAELERLTRGLVRALGTTVGPHTDIPAPDMNTTAEMMDWFVDEYAQMVGQVSPGVVTGKSVGKGGSLGRDSATGRGGVFVLDAYARDQGWEPQDVTLAIQGFGNVGGWFALLAAERGYRVVAVSGSVHGVYKEQGFTPVELREALAKKQLPQGGVISNEELLASAVTVLVPAALGHQITEANVGYVRARSIIEMANAPVSVEADTLLFEKGIHVVPDILANAGGVIVSYFEWVQNTTGETWSETDVAERLHQTITTAYAQVIKESETTHCSLRDAAYLYAARRILSAERARGRI